MSYESQNILQEGTNRKDVMNFIELLKFDKLGSWQADELGKIFSYQWFERDDYKSWSGVELSLFEKDNIIHIETRTNAGRSYYDLVQQNDTIRLLKKYFGGVFYTDYGKGRYLQPQSGPPEHSASGCHLAFSGFGSNLIRARQYFENVSFGDNEKQQTGLYWLDRYNPKLLSNILTLPFLASIAEDYWKSTYIALLKYSDNKESVLKTNRISADRLVQVSNGILSIEEAFAESISFGRISMTCKHFKAIDKNLDLAAILRKPYRRRKKTLFDSLEEMTELRNEIIHQASSSVIIEDKYLTDLINILHDSIDRCYEELTKLKGWHYNKTWGVGRLK